MQYTNQKDYSATHDMSYLHCFGILIATIIVIRKLISTSSIASIYNTQFKLMYHENPFEL